MSERCTVLSSNDAARPILEKIDRRLSLKSESTFFAAAIQKVYEMDEGERAKISEALRAVVVAEHSLRHLITKILWTLSQQQSK